MCRRAKYQKAIRIEIKMQFNFRHRNAHSAINHNYSQNIAAFKIIKIKWRFLNCTMICDRINHVGLFVAIRSSGSDRKTAVLIVIFRFILLPNI